MNKQTKQTSFLRPSRKYVAITSLYFWLIRESLISSLMKPIPTITSEIRQIKWEIVLPQFPSETRGKKHTASPPFLCLVWISRTMSIYRIWTPAKRLVPVHYVWHTIVYFPLRNIAKMCPFLLQTYSEKLIHNFIMCRLNYCSASYSIN